MTKTTTGENFCGICGLQYGMCSCFLDRPSYENPVEELTVNGVRTDGEGNELVTLADARSDMLTRADKGVDCPCCGRLVKLYRRKLHAEMAVFLVKLVKAYRKDIRYYSTREFYPGAVKASTDGSYLVYWELVKKKQGANVAGGKAGQYKPTPIGIEFAMHRCTVLSHIHMLCGKHIGFGGKHVDIIDCLGKKFNYGELMRGN